MSASPEEMTFATESNSWAFQEAQKTTQAD